MSYRQDVADTRYSPSEVFVRGALERGASVVCHDPLVTAWPELQLAVAKELPSVEQVDAVVFAVPHREYATLDVRRWLNGASPVILDANDVLSKAQRRTLHDLGCAVSSIGRGTSA